jgi:hypothetical protein
MRFLSLAVCPSILYFPRSLAAVARCLVTTTPELFYRLPRRLGNRGRPSGRTFAVAASSDFGSSGSEAKPPRWTSMPRHHQEILMGCHSPHHPALPVRRHATHHLRLGRRQSQWCPYPTILCPSQSPHDPIVSTCSPTSELALDVSCVHSSLEPTELDEFVFEGRALPAPPLLGLCLG